MIQLDDALDREIHELETVLLRLTTVRLLMAAGKHGLVERAAIELERAMDGYESAERATAERLAAAGVASLVELADRDPDVAHDIERRAGQLRAIGRDVQVALATTATVADRSLDLARQHLPDADLPTVASTRHPFVVEI